jgi:cytochrome c-type biogenesis protein CcmE
MLPLSLNDWIAAGLVGLAVVIMALAWLTNRKPSAEPFENTAAYDGIEALMHRSSEEGKALLIGMGEGFSGQNPGLGDSVGIMIEQVVLSRSVFNDLPTRSFGGDGALACISQLVVHGAYENAMASELFRSDHSELSGVNAFAWMAGLMPELARKDNAGLILSGTMRPENVLIADLAERKELPLVAATGSLGAQAAFFASGAVVTLGEEYYLPSIGKINQHAHQNQAKTTNWLRIVLAIGLIVAAFLKLSGVLP